LFGKTEHCTRNCLDTQSTHSVFASDWFRECGDFYQEQEQEYEREASSRPEKDWKIIADNLKKRGWSLGWVSAVDCEERTIWIADAHRGDGGTNAMCRPKNPL